MEEVSETWLSVSTFTFGKRFALKTYRIFSSIRLVEHVLVTTVSITEVFETCRVQRAEASQRNALLEYSKYIRKRKLR